MDISVCNTSLCVVCCEQAPVCVHSGKGFGVGVHDWHTMQMCGQQMPSGESVEWAGRGRGGGFALPLFSTKKSHAFDKMIKETN